MARIFKVTSMEVQPKLGAKSDVVISLEFTYGDDQHSTGGLLELEPPGDSFLPIESITEQVALEWLLATVGNRTDEYDHAIQKDIDAKNNVPYVVNLTPPKAVLD